MLRRNQYRTQLVHQRDKGMARRKQSENPRWRSEAETRRTSAGAKMATNRGLADSETKDPARDNFGRIGGIREDIIREVPKNNGGVERRKEKES